MAKKNKNPEVRFKGFNEDWEDKKLGDISNIIGGGTPSTMIPEYWNGNIDWYSPTEIGKEIYANGSNKKITTLGYENCSAKILPPDKTILFTSRAGIGDMAILKKEGTTNQGFQSLILNEDINPYFIYSAGFLIKKYSLKNASGSTFLEISSKTLEKMVIKVPKPTEQKQIGSFFQNLDTLITQHQKKYDKLVILKKAMLDKMFPKNGAVVPEVRFKGFNEDWHEKKLSDITNYYNGKGYESQQGNSGKYELINLNSISIDGGLKPSGKFINDADITLKENDLVMVLSDVGHGDLLGRVAVIPENNRYVLNQRVALLRPDASVNSLFLLYNINDSQSYFKKQGAGMSQLNLSKSSVEDFTSYIPSPEEQTKIGAYFQNLDNQITLHQTQLEKLNNIKKACLIKMFVA